MGGLSIRRAHRVELDLLDTKHPLVGGVRPVVRDFVSLEETAIVFENCLDFRLYWGRPREGPGHRGRRPIGGMDGPCIGEDGHTSTAVLPRPNA